MPQAAFAFFRYWPHSARSRRRLALAGRCGTPTWARPGVLSQTCQVGRDWFEKPSGFAQEDTDGRICRGLADLTAYQGEYFVERYGARAAEATLPVGR